MSNNKNNEDWSFYCGNRGEFNLFGYCSNCEWQPNHDYLTFEDWLDEFEDEIEQQIEQNEKAEDATKS